MKKTSTLFERIIAAAAEKGADARQTTTAAGTLYHDGTQHGKLFDIVLISVDKYNGRHYNHDAQGIAYKAARAAARFKGITIKEIDHPGYYIFQVFRTADAEEAERLKEEAKIFLNAFWEEVHRQHVNSEPDNQSKAIEAGHAALTAAGIIAASEEATPAA